MSWFSKAIDWMGDHKFLTFLGAAGLGSLVVGGAAKAAGLPGAPGVKQLPNGGLVSANAVIPPPNPNVTGQQVLYVTTNDPAPNGNLNARQTSDPISTKIGYWPKYGAVTVLDPGPGNGMILVEGPGIKGSDTGQAVLLKGWAYSGYLKSTKPSGSDVADATQAAMQATDVLRDLGLV